MANIQTRTVSQYRDFEGEKLLRIFDLHVGIYSKCLDESYEWLKVALFGRKLQIVLLCKISSD